MKNLSALLSIRLTICLTVCLSGLLAGCQKEDTVTVAYQGMANPWKHLIKTKAFDGDTKKNIEWKKFNSGAKVINAMASGDVDIAVLGSTPLATALGQGLPLKVVWVMGIIGESEALAAKPGIQSLEELKGKKVATPFGSTSHYHLLLAFKNRGINPKEVEIFNLSPASIVSSWQNNQMDAAYVWAPALEEIKKDGKILISSKDLAKSGDPTFDAIVVREGFLKDNRNFIIKILKKINSLHAKLAAEGWSESAQEVKDIASFVGAKPSDVVASLNGYDFPTAERQIDPALLGKGVSEALKKTSEFLKDQGKISEVKESYLNYIDPTLAEEIAKEITEEVMEETK